MLLGIGMSKLSKTLGHRGEVLLLSVDEFHMSIKVKALNGNDLELAEGALILHRVSGDKSNAQVGLHGLFYRFGSRKLHDYP